MNITEYIHSNWDKTIRFNPEDDDSLIGLPFPYTVPCCEGHFQEMYYWDTYFTNVGLLHTGRLEQAKNNINNMCYLINRFGYMPNGSRTYYLSRSQPPFLSQMVREFYNLQPNAAWLAECYKSLEKEYHYWQTQRCTISGLNRYYGNFTPEEEIDYCHALCDRFQIDLPKDIETQRNYGKSMFSFAESGWDCNSRMGIDVYKYNWVDLNALLYSLEQNMAYFSGILQNGHQTYWQQQATIRANRMNELMWNNDLGAFCDYHFEAKQQVYVVSVAMFYPLFTGMSTPEQAKKTVSLLAKLETQYGIACCENKEDLYDLQWDYPNGWACLHYIVIHGLMRYGYYEDALRIAKKYVALAEDVFQKTGQLWEKYNVVTGNVSTAKEYETPTMMGWSAGVYLDCCSIINNAK